MTGTPARKESVSHRIITLQAGVLALVFAVMGGTAIFLATAWLLIKGGPHVGMHLNLLSNYFVGYSVTWEGAVVGFLYGALTGGLAGWAIATIYNTVIARRRSAFRQ
ncbi:MAG TPA: hypothetical protein VJ746_09020 [Nitrospira sp.]|nr:hypothetical protein [Nitrospira sp.]